MKISVYTSLFCVYVSFLGLFPKMQHCQDILHEDFLHLYKGCLPDMSSAEDVLATTVEGVFVEGVFVKGVFVEGVFVEACSTKMGVFLGVFGGCVRGCVGDVLSCCL